MHEKKTTFVRVRLTPSIKEALEASAARDTRSVGGQITHLLRLHLGLLRADEAPRQAGANE